jgi:hypothetical protein
MTEKTELEQNSTETNPAKTPLMSFDRWFATTGKPIHHKSGMLVYLRNTFLGKRTKADWDNIFMAY